MGRLPRSRDSRERRGAPGNHVTGGGGGGLGGSDFRRWLGRRGELLAQSVRHVLATDTVQSQVAFGRNNGSRLPECTGGAPALPGQRLSGFDFSAAARRLGRRSLACLERTTPVAAIRRGARSLRGNRPGDRCRRAGPPARASSRARTGFARSRSGRRSSRTR